MTTTAKIERLDDGRYIIRTATGSVARTTASEPYYAYSQSLAEAALAYLAMPYAERRKAAHWLKSTFGVE